MEKVIALLQEKNGYLEQYYDLNESEIPKITSSNFENLEVFYQSRDHLLEQIRGVDENLEQLNQEMAGPTQNEHRMIEDILNIRDDLVKDILAQDLEILSHIESAKSKMLKELQALHHNRKAVNAYRSPNVISRLDEEL